MEKLDELVTSMSGFKKAYVVTGQTYSRKVDLDILNVLGSLGASIHKVRRWVWSPFLTRRAGLSNMGEGSSQTSPAKQIEQQSIFALEQLLP